MPRILGIMPLKSFKIQTIIMVKNINLRSFLGCVTLFFLVIFFTSFFNVKKAYALAPDIWWPTNNVEIKGTQPFKGMLQDHSLNQYSMYWQVDGGNTVWMGDNYQDYPHKEAQVDLSGWNWKGTGPYVLTFTAKDSNGQIIGQTNRTIYTGSIQNISTPTPPPTPTPTPTPTPSPTISPTVSNSITGKKLYVDPNTSASAQVKAWQYSQPANATLMKKIADSSQSTWIGGWLTNEQIREKITSVVSKAKLQSAIPTFVLYNIPQRDCGSYSAGGANNADSYKSWINNIANVLSNNLGNSNAIVILEPDSLAQSSCLSSGDQSIRFDLINYAVTTLKSKKGVLLYVDAGHSAWRSVDEMSNLLKRAGIDKTDGFSLNVSNFQDTAKSISYGKEISGKVNSKHFVIDTSRNGNGSNGEWCNPKERALGNRPTTSTGDSLVDAFLWIKTPGESDGTCNGGPNAGVWWPSYALDLASLTRW